MTREQKEALKEITTNGEWAGYPGRMWCVSEAVYQYAYDASLSPDPMKTPPSAAAIQTLDNLTEVYAPSPPKPEADDLVRKLEGDVKYATAQGFTLWAGDFRDARDRIRALQAELTEARAELQALAEIRSDRGNEELRTALALFAKLSTTEESVHLGGAMRCLHWIDDNAILAARAALAAAPETEKK